MQLVQNNSQQLHARPCLGFVIHSGRRQPSATTASPGRVMSWVCALQMIHIEPAQVAPLSPLSFLVLLMCSLLPAAAAAEAVGGCWQAFNQRVKALKRDVLALYYAGVVELLQSTGPHIPLCSAAAAAAAASIVSNSRCVQACTRGCTYMCRVSRKHECQAHHTAKSSSTGRGM
jgi:hypothetical protein